MSTWTPWVLDAQMAAKQKALLNSRASDALKKMNDTAYTYEQRQEFASIAIKLATAENNQPPTTAAEAEAADRARKRPIQI